MLKDFVTKVRATKRLGPLPEFRLLALDPGETTGWSIWDVSEHDVYLTETGQAETWPIEQSVRGISELIGRVSHPRIPVLLVHEAYNIYAHKLQQHTHSNVPTLRVIGVIETLCVQQRIPLLSQTAQVAKAWATDSNLKTWGVYQVGMRHARDSIRHGLYCIMFTDFDNLLNMEVSKV